MVHLPPKISENGASEPGVWGKWTHQVAHLPQGTQLPPKLCFDIVLLHLVIFSK
ncbi:hypothetical protein LSTR_LSTR003744, partial [Laodelphax striatellus]